MNNYKLINSFFMFSLTSVTSFLEDSAESTMEYVDRFLDIITDGQHSKYKKTQQKVSLAFNSNNLNGLLLLFVYILLSPLLL